MREEHNVENRKMKEQLSEVELELKLTMIRLDGISGSTLYHKSNTVFTR